jgi:hypothetical protein
MDSSVFASIFNDKKKKIISINTSPGNYLHRRRLDIVNGEIYQGEVFKVRDKENDQYLYYGIDQFSSITIDENLEEDATQQTAKNHIDSEAIVPN